MSAPVSSTRADWAGACGAALAPIAQALKAQVLHADESPITILARRGEKTRGYGPMHPEEVDASKYVLAKRFSKLGGHYSGVGVAGHVGTGGSTETSRPSAST